MTETLTYNPAEANPPALSSDEQNSLEVAEKLGQQEADLYAGKFENAEELENAYLELQRKMGSGDIDEDTEEAYLDEDDEYYDEEGEYEDYEEYGEYEEIDYDDDDWDGDVEYEEFPEIPVSVPVPKEPVVSSNLRFSITFGQYLTNE
jgi:hypothetical protein